MECARGREYSPNAWFTIPRRFPCSNDGERYRRIVLELEDLHDQVKVWKFGFMDSGTNIQLLVTEKEVHSQAAKIVNDMLEMMYKESEFSQSLHDPTLACSFPQG